MTSSSMIGIGIGTCFLIIGLLIRIIPINSKWLFTLYTKEQRVLANQYISWLLILFGAGFCVIASLPLLTDFRGLRVETFFVLTFLTLNLLWYLTKKHVGRMQH